MTLNKDNRDSIVSYRLQRAKETLTELKANIEMKFWRIAANRLYYACYYAATALLVQNNLTTRTHSGVISQLSLHFIKKGLLNVEYGKLYKKLFELRQTGDYDDLVIIKEDEVLGLLAPAEKFIAEIENLIKNKELKNI